MISILNGICLIILSFVLAECLVFRKQMKYDASCDIDNGSLYQIIFYTSVSCILEALLMQYELFFPPAYSLFPVALLAFVVIIRYLFHIMYCKKAESEYRKVCGDQPTNIGDILRKEEVEKKKETSKEEDEPEEERCGIVDIDQFISDTSEIISKDGFGSEMKAAAEAVNESLKKMNTFPDSRTKNSDEVKRLVESYLPAALLLLKSYEEIIRTVPDETKRSRETLLMIQHTFEDMDKAIRAMSEGMINRDLDKIMEAARNLQDMLLKEIPPEEFDFS